MGFGGQAWRRQFQSADGTLTRLKSGANASLPAKAEVDGNFHLPSRGWAMPGGDVFEDDKRLVARLEVPGMEKEDFDIEVLDDALVVRGEKSIEGESREGRHRSLRCAYAGFRRVVPLTMQVLADRTKASCPRNRSSNLMAPRYALLRKALGANECSPVQFSPVRPE